MKFGIFYEHQLPAAVARRLRVPPDPGRARADRVRRLASASTTRGRSSTTSSRSTRTRARPRCSSPPRRSARKNIRLGHGIVQTPPPFNHPARIAERIAMLDLVSQRPRRLRHRRVVVGGRARRLHDRPDREARDVGRGPARRGALHDREPFTGHSGEFVTMPPRNVVPEAAPEAAPAAVGRVQPARHDPPRRAERRSARSRSRSSIPKRRSTGSTTTTRRSRREGVPIGDAVNANVACVTTFMCHDDEDEALRRGLEGANFFGYSLAHYYVFGRHQPAVHERVGRVPAAARRAGLRPRGGASPRRRTTTGSARRSSSRAIGGLRGAVGTPDQIREYLRALRGVRRRPGDLLLPGRQEPPRAHHGSARAVRPRGAARVHGPRREAAARQGRSGSRRSSTRCMARKPADGSPAAADAPTTRSRRSRGRWPTAPATTTSTRCSTTSRSSPRSARAASKACSAR